MLKLSRLALCAGLFCALALPAASESVGMNVRTIAQFKTGSDQKRFGSLDFLGGLEFSSFDSRLQSLSSIRFRGDGQTFVSVTDTGNWLTGRIGRDSQGHLSDLVDVAIHPILLRGGRPGWKLTTDAEGLALRNGQAVVSFEQQHRVDVYRDPGFEASEPSRGLDFLIPARELRRNAGMETIAASPQSSRLKGSLVVVAERSLDEKGNLLAAILEGPLKGQFTVVRHDPYDATDGAFLPNGDLLLLERRFSFLGGLGMRIRRIKGDGIVPGAVVDGEVLIEADLNYAIDNMEGLDVVTGADGKPHLILISDDNGNLMQRNVMLEFQLND